MERPCAGRACRRCRPFPPRGARSMDAQPVRRPVILAYAPGHVVGVAFSRTKRRGVHWRKPHGPAFAGLRSVGGGDVARRQTGCGSQSRPADVSTHAGGRGFHRLAGGRENWGRHRFRGAGKAAGHAAGRIARNDRAPPGFGTARFFPAHERPSRIGVVGGMVVGEPKLLLQPVGRIEGRLIADQPVLVSGVSMKFDTLPSAANNWCCGRSAKTLGSGRSDDRCRGAICDFRDRGGEIGEPEGNPQLPVRPGFLTR